MFEENKVSLLNDSLPYIDDFLFLLYKHLLVISHANSLLLIP